MDQKLHLAACGVGIMASLVVYGVIQERIMTVSFGRNAERFTWSVFLVLCNRIVTTTLAAGILSAQRQPLAPAAPIRSYAAVSFSNVIATSCQYEALKYVAFPVQTLGKCAKMIPVMIWGTLISRKVYSAKDYTVALLVTAGCTGFLFSRGAGYGSSKATSLPGGVLMLTYLAFDGFTSTFQVVLLPLDLQNCQFMRLVYGGSMPGGVRCQGDSFHSSRLRPYQTFAGQNGVLWSLVSCGKP
ncbi:hypothetical protein ABBQ38_000421 [Trebouxia sp. C0009 RCD-2024]